MKAHEKVEEHEEEKTRERGHRDRGDEFGEGEESTNTATSIATGSQIAGVTASYMSIFQV